MKTISLKVPETLAARLESAARRKRVSKSALLREALETYLNGVKQGAGASAHELVKDLIGSLNSGVGDLSYNPKHMEGFGK